MLCLQVGLNISKPPQLGQLYRNFHKWHAAHYEISSSDLTPSTGIERIGENDALVDLPDIVGHAQ